jgi:hypothetical protein
MILKYGDKKTGWTWLGSVQEVSEVSDDEIPSDVRLVGNDSESQCYQITFNDGEIEFIILAVGEIYLCNEESGSTIDVLKGGRRR